MSLVFWTTDNDNNEMLSCIVVSVIRKSSLFMRCATVQKKAIQASRYLFHHRIRNKQKITDFISLLSVLFDTAY